MNICVIGSGTVGLDTYKGFAKLGHRVLLYSFDRVGLDNLSEKLDDVRYRLSDALKDVDAVFICVPTPTTENGIELSYVKDAVVMATSYLRERKRYCVIVVRSTVLPNVMDEIISPLVDSDIGLCHNPAFITEGSRLVNIGFDSEPRIVIGQRDSKSGDVLEGLYQPLDKPIFRTDFNTSAMIKYAANCALATRISYWNEIALICKQLGIDSELVAKVAGLDPRIGQYGTVTGMAFGGSCLCKDLAAFNRFVGNDCGFKETLLDKVEKINDFMKETYGSRE